MPDLGSYTYKNRCAIFAILTFFLSSISIYLNIGGILKFSCGFYCIIEVVNLKIGQCYFFIVSTFSWFILALVFQFLGIVIPLLLLH